MTTHDIGNDNFEVAKYLLREEEDSYLMFVNEQEKTYILNSTAATIVKCLDNRESLKKICDTLKYKYQFIDTDIEVQLQEFLTRLEQLGLIRKNGHISQTPLVPYISPSILDLEETDEQVAQCRMFGMP